MLLTVYDVETNGFIEHGKVPDIYQFGYIRVDTSFRVHGSGSLYLYDPATYSPHKKDAEDVHGITIDFLEKHKNDFNKNLSTMYALLKDSLVVGKNNITFDNIVVNGFINRYRPEKAPAFNLGKSLDVQAYMAKYYRDWCAANGKPYTNRSKGQLSDYIQVMDSNEQTVLDFAANNGIQLSTERPHDALYDATLTYMCLVYLMLIKKVPMKPV